MKKKHILANIICAVFLFLLIFAAIYLCTYYKAEGVEEYLNNFGDVAVSETSYGYFIDGAGEDRCLIFYPGARVDEKAYIPLLYSLAENGVDCKLIKMPFHMAIFSVKAADKVVDGNYKKWYIGGHSMGGAMAAKYLASSDKEFSALVLLGAYSADDLSETDIKALSVYGSRDGVLNMEKVASGRAYFKEGNYTETVIDGGNHAGIACYGSQSGDNDAEISPSVQRAQTVEAIIGFLP